MRFLLSSPHFGARAHPRALHDSSLQLFAFGKQLFTKTRRPALLSRVALTDSFANRLVHILCEFRRRVEPRGGPRRGHVSTVVVVVVVV
jgi:hypothetical protein